MERKGSDKLKLRGGNQRNPITHEKNTKPSRVVKTDLKYYRWKKTKKERSNPWITRIKEKRATLVKSN